MQRFGEIETMLRTQLIQVYCLPEEAVTLFLLTQISVPRHLYITASLPRPHAQVSSPVSLYFCPNVRQVSSSLLDSDLPFLEHLH